MKRKFSRAGVNTTINTKTTILTTDQMIVKVKDFAYDSSSATNLANPRSERNAVIMKKVGNIAPMTIATISKISIQYVISSTIVIVTAPIKKTSVNHFNLLDEKNSLKPSIKLLRIGISIAFSS